MADAIVVFHGPMVHIEIAKSAGTSRSRVTAIANGNTRGVSTDVLIRVLAATGYRAKLRVKKSAAWWPAPIREIGPNPCIEIVTGLRQNADMSKVSQIESELGKLSQAELREVRDWMDDMIEDDLEFTPEFESAIQRSEREMGAWEIIESSTHSM